MFASLALCKPESQRKQKTFGRNCCVFRNPRNSGNSVSTTIFHQLAGEAETMADQPEFSSGGLCNKKTCLLFGNV